MASAQGAVILRHIRRLVAAQCPRQPSDMELLQQFIADGDETAFAAIVQRHGTMVLGVCRSVLHHQQDAEDAFQAAFLVLARKAHTVRKQEALSSWLHGVAYRLSLKARSRRPSIVPCLVEGGGQAFAISAADDLTMRELRAILHEELDLLGDKYRTPLLLCYWEGRTRDEAAEQLGMSADAFKKRLERARNLLGSRLVRRGLVPSTAFFGTLFLAGSAQAALPGVLITTTAQSAVAFAVGKTAGASATAIALANGAIQTMNITKWSAAILMILFLGSLGTGLGFGGYHLLASTTGDPKGKAVEAKQAPDDKGVRPPKTDKERIVGTWRVAKGQANGENLPPEFVNLARLTFTKDGETVTTVIGESKKGKYNLVGAGKIDIALESPQSALAIYRFDGNDRLEICANNGGKDRPEEFSAKKGTGRVLFSLVRAKPGEEKPTPEEITKYAGEAQKIRQANARTVSINNLKQIGLAFHNYHDVENSFPARAIYSKDGKTPLQSWRVAILPYIAEKALYDDFKLDEAWDSPHNKKLIPRMPKLYEPPSAKNAKEGETYYQVIAGSGTLFDGPKKMKLQDIKNGTSNTLLAIEAKDAVTWTRPADLTLPKDKTKLPAVSELYPNGFIALKCDGSVHFVPRTISAEAFRAMVAPVPERESK